MVSSKIYNNGKWFTILYGFEHNSVFKDMTVTSGKLVTWLFFVTKELQV